MDSQYAELLIKKKKLQFNVSLHHHGHARVLKNSYHDIPLDHAKKHKRMVKMCTNKQVHINVRL